MKSRYSAFATNNPKYIIKTTHKENSQYLEDKKLWEEDLSLFSKTNEFKCLEILEFIDGDHEAFVTFKATIFSGDVDHSFIEKSKFYKVDNQWLYHSGTFQE